MEIILFILTFLSLLAVIYFYNKHKKLSHEITMLRQILEVKDTTISNLQASRVAVKDVLENFSSHEEVMKLIDAGESRESVSTTLGIPVNKIELIVKFDKIKKEKQGHA